jgi:hypothetical protein
MSKQQYRKAEIEETNKKNIHDLRVSILISFE